MASSTLISAARTPSPAAASKAADASTSPLPTVSRKQQREVGSPGGGPISEYGSLWSPSQSVASTSCRAAGIPLPKHRMLSLSMSAPQLARPESCSAKRHWALHTLRVDDNYSFVTSLNGGRDWSPRRSSKKWRPGAAAARAAEAAEAKADANPNFLNRPASAALESPQKGGRLPPLFRPRSPMRTPYNLIHGSKVAALLEEGTIAFIKSTYFEDCLISNRPIGKRQDIPMMFLWDGGEALKLWAKHGKCFLCIISACWLSKKHPDPNLFHLSRLVRVLNEYKKLWQMEEVAIVMDYCSIWQHDGEKMNDKMAEVRKEQFRKGIDGIFTLYAHRSVTSIQLVAVPEEEMRKYDDRGWTLLISIMIDAKQGDWHRWVFDAFDPMEASEDAYAFFLVARPGKHRVLPTPEGFKQELEGRRTRARDRGVALFANEADFDQTLERYQEAFWHFTRVRKLTFDSVGWQDKDVELLVAMLPSCPDLTQLLLYNNNIGVVGAKALVHVIPRLLKLQHLGLTGNPLCRECSAKDSLEEAWRKAVKPLRMLEL